METHILLGGIPLNNDLALLEAREWAATKQEVKRSVTGGLIVFQQRLVDGRPITLQGSESAGWIKNDVMQQIYTLAAEMGRVLPFQYYTWNTFVMFRNHEPPAVFGELYHPHGNFYEGDVFKNVTIKLMEVSRG